MTTDVRLANPVGDWTGVARYDGNADEISVSFTDDGTVTLRTPVSTGRGTWVATGPRTFTYRLTERLDPRAGAAGLLDIEVRAELVDGGYRGDSVATITDPEGTVLRTITAEVTAGSRT
ncbi:hypothetical protein [Saccharothrix syringae]|uniref:DUF1579 domain-containing protein n=1 Tax=Saccharothrix syringae TaxID=103733 RepID=A0A5Q0H6A6_SACSY|nr:hypothetical protein [Saccharothrix syringae]QFZ21445.1 hypothetical protein EKG83_32280 [Saccharothrix syringae]